MTAAQYDGEEKRLLKEEFALEILKNRHSRHKY